MAIDVHDPLVQTLLTTLARRLGVEVSDLASHLTRLGESEGEAENLAAASREDLTRALAQRLGVDVAELESRLLGQTESAPVDERGIVLSRVYTNDEVLKLLGVSGPTLRRYRRMTGVSPANSGGRLFWTGEQVWRMLQLMQGDRR